MQNVNIIDRGLLKLSGEIFGQEGKHIDSKRYDNVARQLIEIRKQTKIQLAIVVGSGNIMRGREIDISVDRNEADAAGMLATIMNGIFLREALVRNGETETRLMTSINIPQVAEPYIRNKALHHLEENRLIIISGGLGVPRFSTDSAAALYAEQLKCEMVFKASNVDGVYDQDPKKSADAKKYEEISHREAIHQRLGIMDATAFTICENSGMPIFVFNIKELARLPEIIRGNYSFGTVIRG